MTVISRLTELAQAIGADIKALVTGKADRSELNSYRALTNRLFTKVTDKVDYIPLVDSLDYGVRHDYTIHPPSDTQAVSPSILNTFNVDTTNGTLVGQAHGIGQLDIYTVSGGKTCNLIFGKETRITLKNSSRLEEFVLHKWVFEPAATNSGTVGTVTLDSLDDMSVSAPYVEKFRRIYADPRMVDYMNGGVVISPAVIDGNVTLSDRHSGKVVFLNSASDVTVTIAANVVDGFRVKLVQGTLGGRITVVSESGGRTITAGIDRRQTQFAFDNLEVYAVGGSYLMLSWPVPVPSITVDDATTARTLVASDAMSYVRMNSASASTVTLPPQSSVAWQDNAEIHIEQTGAGAVTITPGSGVTINAPGGLVIAGRYSVVSLKRTGLNAWTLRGSTKSLPFDDLVVNATATGTVTLNVGSAQVFDVTLTGNTTIAFSNIPVPVNQSYSWLVRITQGATLRTLAWPTITWIATGGTAPATPAAGKVTEYVFSTQNGVLVLGRKGAAT